MVVCLGQRNYHKDLHIVINDTVIILSFSSHVRNVCRNVSCQTGVLLRLRKLIPTSAKLYIVKFAILPGLILHIVRLSGISGSFF